MNEAVELLKQKTGMSDEMAQKAVTTVVEFIKGKLPPSMASQLDGLMSGDTASAAGGFADKAKSFLGGLGGKKSEG